MVAIDARRRGLGSAPRSAANNTDVLVRRLPGTGHLPTKGGAQTVEAIRPSTSARSRMARRVTRAERTVVRELAYGDCRDDRVMTQTITPGAFRHAGERRGGSAFELLGSGSRPGRGQRGALDLSVERERQVRSSDLGPEDRVHRRLTDRLSRGTGYASHRASSHQVTALWCGSTTRKATSSGTLGPRNVSREAATRRSRPARALVQCRTGLGRTSRSSGAPPGRRHDGSSVPRHGGPPRRIYSHQQSASVGELSRDETPFVIAHPSSDNRTVPSASSTRKAVPSRTSGRPARDCRWGLVAGEGRSARDHRPRSWWRAAADGLRRGPISARSP